MAIKLKNRSGKFDTYETDTFFMLDENGEEVQFTQGTGEPNLMGLMVTENGTYTPDEGVDGFAIVDVNVPKPLPKLHELEVIENGTYTPNEGFDGLSKVIVAVEGSSADLRYVTFMNHDGTVELGKKAVAVGDDCADPIARGIFDTPTKESDAQYNYTHNGWATEVNGEVDSNWNKAITEDKTVYASFEGALRYYTITYYDVDGTTVLKTESLAYGTVPSYKPTKDGVVFAGWSPTPETVSGDASYVASWSEKLTFAGATWNDIARVAEEGTAADHFKLGDTRNITFNNNGETYDVKFQIVGFNHDNTEDGGKAGITLMSYYALRKETVGQTTGYFDVCRMKGWKDSTIRTTLNSTTLGFLPDDLVPHIKSVQKLSTISGNAGTLETTVDKLFIPSITELGLSHSKTASNQGVAYAKRPTVRSNITQSKGETITATTNSSGTTIYIGTRSGNSYSSYSQTALKCTDGYADYCGYDMAIGCQIGFCI